MPKYGLTPNGPNIKRLDVILDEMHSALTKKLGVNTKQNPESLLNCLLTDIADKCAELWEFGENVYYSQYPSSAENVNLDNAMQYAGIVREMSAKSYYPILCTGLDGTKIPVGTIIATDTNPTTNLVAETAGEITRAGFNKAVVIQAVDHATSALSIVLNGELFSADTLNKLAASVKSNDFTVTYENGKLTIEAKNETSSNTMVLSENLTTETVSSIVTFATEEYGDIVIPNGIITKIVKSVTGLNSVVNVGTYIAGRLAETDSEARKSYIDKIYNRSSRMLESVRSAILENVQGVESVAVYENDTNLVDSEGRPPHSIEVVVDGGDKTKIAQQILAKKAAGISTYAVDGENGVVVTLKGNYDEDIDIRFNRPYKVYIWFQVGVTFTPSVKLPTNYAELINQTIIDCMAALGTGVNVVPQQFTEPLYSNVAGIDYFDIKIFATRDEQETPTEYPKRSVNISQREIAVTTEDRIEVIING